MPPAPKLSPPRPAILPIAVMAFAVVGLLLFLDLAMGVFPWPRTNTGSTNVSPAVVKNVSPYQALEQAQSMAALTKDWLTYTNQKGGWSLRLPPGWTGYALVTLASGAKITHPKTASVSFTLISTLDQREPGIQVGTNGTTRYVLRASTGPIERGYQAAWNEIPTIARTVTFTNPTIGWKTYRNIVHKYTLRYPTSWAITPTGALISLLYRPSRGQQDAVGDLSVTIERTLGIEESLETWFKAHEEMTAEKKAEVVAAPCHGTATVDDITSATATGKIGGLASITQVITYQKPGSCKGLASTIKQYFVKNGTTLYVIRAQTPTGAGATELLATVDQVVGTISFVN